MLLDLQSLYFHVYHLLWSKSTKIFGIATSQPLGFLYELWPCHGPATCHSAPPGPTKAERLWEATARGTAGTGAPVCWLRWLRNFEMLSYFRFEIQQLTTPEKSTDFEYYIWNSIHLLDTSSPDDPQHLTWDGHPFADPTGLHLPLKIAVGMAEPVWWAVIYQPLRLWYDRWHQRADLADCKEFQNIKVDKKYSSQLLHLAVPSG